MSALILIASRLCARFGFWLTSAQLLSRMQLLGGANDGAVRLLSYALLLRCDRPQAKAIFLRLLRQNLDRSPKANFQLAYMAQRMGRLGIAALIYRRVARQLQQQPAELQVAQSMADLVTRCASGSIHGDIAAMVDALNLPPADGVPLVIFPVSRNLFDLFGLWRDQAVRHLRGHLVALTLDEAASTTLRAESDCAVLNLSRWFIFTEKGGLDSRCKGNLWFLRVLVLRELVRRGHTVMSLDLDAVLVGDLEPMLQGLPQADIVAQQDYSLPVDVARELGFILCCGFMLLRPTPACVAFMDRYADQTIQEQDDQMAINHLLSRAGVTDRVTTATSLSFSSGGVRWVCPDKSLVSRDLSYGTVIRHFQQLSGQTIVDLKTGLGL